MKKAVCIFLVCVLFSITFSSCTKGERPNNVTESEMTTNFEQNNANMIYVQTLDSYRKAIQLLPRYIDSKEGTDVYLKQLNVVESEKELFDTIFGAAFLYYPPNGVGDRTSPIHKLSYGYAIKDLNADGIEELILLTDNGYILAVFSHHDDAPVLLGSYRPRSSCTVDTEGFLHHYGSGGADVFSHTVYKIADGGDKLDFIAEFGADGHELIDDTYRTKYYEKVNGETVFISKDRYDQLEQQYGTLADTSEKIGFTAVFEESEIYRILSVEEAKQIAWDYWKIEPNSNDPDTGFPFSISVTLDGTVYHADLSWLVDNHHYSTIEKIDIDAYTGRIISEKG